MYRDWKAKHGKGRGSNEMKTSNCERNGKRVFNGNNNNWRKNQASTGTPAPPPPPPPPPPPAFGPPTYLGGFQITKSLKFQNVTELNQLPPVVTPDRISYVHMMKPNLLKDFDQLKYKAHDESHYERIKLDYFFKWLLNHTELVQRSSGMVAFSDTFFHLMMTPYRDTKWTLYATRFNGKIYLTHAVDYKKEEMTEFQITMENISSYCGQKFYQLLTDEIPEHESGKFFAVQEKSLCSHKLTVVSDMKAIKEKPQLESPRFMDINLTTSNAYQINWWARAAIDGFEDMLVGYKGQDNRLEKVEFHKVDNLPKINDGFYWDPQKCFNYLDRALQVVSNKIEANNPHVLYIFKPNPIRGQDIVFKGTSEPNLQVQIIPPWFLKALAVPDPVNQTM